MPRLTFITSADDRFEIEADSGLSALCPDCRVVMTEGLERPTLRLPGS